MKPFFTLLILSLTFTCCKTRDNEPVGGKGGNAVLKITPRHHTTEIDSCTVYIKYNASNVATVYDDSAVCMQEGGSPVATFVNLKKGNYYLFGQGWDSAIGDTVIGGLPFKIIDETTTTISLPVSENH